MVGLLQNRLLLLLEELLGLLAQQIVQGRVENVSASAGQFLLPIAIVSSFRLLSEAPNHPPTHVRALYTHAFFIQSATFSGPAHAAACEAP